jgi:hypothetical protein
MFSIVSVREEDGGNGGNDGNEKLISGTILATTVSGRE